MTRAGLRQVCSVCLSIFSKEAKKVICRSTAAYGIEGICQSCNSKWEIDRKKVRPHTCAKIDSVC